MVPAVTNLAIACEAVYRFLFCARGGAFRRTGNLFVPLAPKARTTLRPIWT